MHHRIFAFAGAALLALACTVTSTTTPGSGPGGGGATAGQISGCKQSCDKMKFFGCSSAEGQAACYSDCDQATPSQIQVFTGCADNSVCDPACRTNITPKPSGSSGSSGGSGGGGGATASSCGTACDKLVSCSLIRVGDKSACLTECQKSAYQYQIDCVNNVACDKVASACGSTTTGGCGSSGTTSGGTSGTTSGGFDASNDQFDIQACQTACDNLNFFSCLSATEHSACRALCASSTTAKRDTFKSCANGAGGDCPKGQACYATFQN